jgi:glycosyltransferase involved in cell wall biosynthesis
MSDGALSVSLDVTAIPTKAAGAGQYALAISAALAARPDLSTTLITRRADAVRWRERAPESQIVAVAPEARPLRLGWEQVALPRRLRTLGVDVHHGLHYTMPERARLPVVVTVHDCTYFDHPEWHEPTKVRFFRRAIAVAARRAAAVVCVSQATADRFTALCRPNVPVVVAPHGVDHHRFTPVEPSAGLDIATLERLGINVERPLVVFVGTLEPRKGVGLLIDAFERIADVHEDALLVLAGQPGWGNALAPLATAAHRERVIVTGYVPDAAVPALLRRAAVAAYPSLGEGFGLPALEALACGAPLLTTAGTPMADAAGDAAFSVAPGDAAAVAEALDSILRGGPALEARRRMGFERVAPLTWEAAAERHVEAYRLAAHRA